VITHDDVTYVDTFAELPADAPIGTTLLQRRDPDRPEPAIRRTERTRPWSRVTVETISINKQPYRDQREEYAVTFEGGTPSARRGWELPHGTHPPRDTYMDQFVVYSTHTPEEKTDAQVADVKAKIKPLLGHRAWDVDCTISETRSMGQQWLKEFSCVERKPFSTTYRVVVITPNMS